jgi:hypothetical protein
MRRVCVGVCMCVCVCVWGGVCVHTTITTGSQALVHESLLKEFRSSRKAQIASWVASGSVGYQLYILVYSQHFTGLYGPRDVIKC